MYSRVTASFTRLFLSTICANRSYLRSCKQVTSKLNEKRAGGRSRPLCYNTLAITTCLRTLPRSLLTARPKRKPPLLATYNAVLAQEKRKKTGMHGLSSDSSATNKQLAIRSCGITISSRWAHDCTLSHTTQCKSVLFGPEMMHVHLQAKMRGCALVNCGHSARQRSSPTFSCCSAKLNGRKACSRPAVLVRAEKKDQGMHGST